MGAGVDRSRAASLLGAGAGPVGGGHLPPGGSAGAARRLGVLAVAARWQAGLPAAALRSPELTQLQLSSSQLQLSSSQLSIDLTQLPAMVASNPGNGHDLNQGSTQQPRVNRGWVQQI